MNTDPTGASRILGSFCDQWHERLLENDLLSDGSVGRVTNTHTKNSRVIREMNPTLQGPAGAHASPED